MLEGLLGIVISIVLMAIVFYVIRVVALFKLMTYAGVPNTWLAFIPASEFYIFYKLLNGTIVGRDGEWSEQKTRNIFVRLPYVLLIVSFLVFILLEIANASNVSSMFEWGVNIVYMVVYGMIGHHFSRIYLKKDSSTGAILAVLSPALFMVYVLVNIDKYRDSVDRFHNPEIDFDNVTDTYDVIDSDKNDVKTVDNETLEELFTDVKVDNDAGSGIHLTKVIDKEVSTADEEDDEDARKLALAKEMFDAEVASMEAEKEYQAYVSDALEADLKALEAEFELAKVEEEERLRIEANRVEAERIAKDAENVKILDSLELDVDGDEEIEIEETPDSVGSVYGTNEGVSKSFSYDSALDLTESDNDKEK